MSAADRIDSHLYDAHAFDGPGVGPAAFTAEALREAAGTFAGLAVAATRVVVRIVRLGFPASSRPNA